MVATLAKEEAKATNLEWYGRAFESAPVGMCFADNKFHFVDVNPAFCAMLGYSRDELLAKTIIEITFPEDVSNTAEKLQKIFRGGSGTFKVEKRYLTKTGEVVWGLTTVSVAERDNEGRVVRTFAVIQDITSRKKLESSLKESETNYHTMIEMSPDAIAVHSGGKVVYVNSAAVRALGAKKPEDVIGKPTLSFVHPDSLAVVTERIKKMAETGEMAPLLEEKFLRLDGTPIDVEVVARPIIYEGKKAVQVVIHDITESKKIKDELRKSEARYRILAEAAHDMIFVLDREGTITYANSFAAAQFGLAPEQMIGKKRTDFFGPSAGTQDISLSKVFETGESLYRETKYPLGNKMVWLGTWLVSLKKNDKEVTEILGVSRDISAQKAAELELMQLNRTLTESEESYHGLFESVAEAIYVQDKDGKFLDVNPGAEKMYGYPREWFIGKSPLDVSAPGRNDLVKIKAAVDRAFAGEPQEFEFWGVRKTGEAFPKDVRLYKGKYFGKEVVIALATDITARKKSETVLRESEERFRSLFTNMLDGFAHCEMIFDEKNVPVDFVYLDVNDRFTELTGLRDVVGKKVSVVIPGLRESNPELFELYGRAAATGETARFETYVPQLSIWLSISVYSPQKGHFVAVFSNITQKKRAEEGLRLSREVIKAVGEAADLSEALSAMLRIVCVSTGWVYGEAWVPDTGRGLLELSPAWFTADKELEKFRQTSEGFTFKPGEGLPGRVFQSKKPEWLPDVSVNDRVFLRAKDALTSGIKAGLGVPIVIEDQVLVVIVFFTAEIRKEEKELTEVVTSLGSQLGLVFQRKKAVEELEKSEEKYRNLVDNMSEGLGVQDKNGLIMFMNKRACEILGYELEELIGKPVTMVFDEENQKILREQMARRRKGEHQSYEIAWLRKDGGKIDTIIAPSPRFDEQGNLVESIAVFTDITDRKKTEEALAKANLAVEKALKITSSEKAKLETVLNGIADGVFVIDDHGKIVLFNRAAEKISGFSFDSIKEKQYWEVLSFIPEGLSETKVDFIRNALSGHDGELDVNLSFKKASGKVIPIQASAATLDGRGKLSIGIVVIFRDVSKEREIQQLRDEFMMIASHELRAPMTAVKWLVSMMLEGSYGAIAENLKSPLGTIATATDRLIHLVNDMINITRVEAGNMRLTLTDFDIKKMIDDLLVAFGSEAKKNNIQVDAVGVESVMVQADSDWMAQILSNLIDNAIKFNREGGKIAISTEKDNDYLNIALADTGIGIPDDFKEKLFTKFAQVLSKKAGKPIGTGLGLFISRELARGMGSDLQLTATKIDEGSTFMLKIPLSGSPAAGVTLKNHKKKAG